MKKDIVYEGEAWLRLRIGRTRDGKHTEVVVTIQPNVSKGKLAWGRVK